MTLFIFIRNFVLGMWPVTVFAAPALQQSYDSVPGIAWLVASVLSTLGGVTALMFRLEARLSAPESKPIAPLALWVLVTSQMFCSWFAGAIFFLLGLHYELPIFLAGAVVAMASFGGARSIEWAISKATRSAP